MSDELQISPHIGHGLRLFLYSQLFCMPPYPKQTFTGQTVIVTGANIGLGLEAARHFYRLGCEKLILAVRTVSKGQDAKEDITRSVKHRTDTDKIEVWSLDLASTDSTLSFAERVKTQLSRVDVLVENAGINISSLVVSEGFEQTIQVNVINTFLLATSILPILRETKSKFASSSPHLVIVTSEAHRLTKFTEINAPDIYERLNNGEDYNGQARYEISKLLEVLFVRELVSREKATRSSKPPVIITLVNPGLCKSTLGRDKERGLVSRAIIAATYGIIGRSAEQGARTLVHGASATSELHGTYMSDGKAQDLDEWIHSDVGKRAQKKVFEQTMKVIEMRKPGVQESGGL